MSFNIINAARNYLFANDSKLDGKDHYAEARPDASDEESSLDKGKFWWTLEKIADKTHQGMPCYHIRNEEYGYLFAADNDDNQRTDAEDHDVETRPNASDKDKQKSKYQWAISDRERRLDWCNVHNLAYGQMFAAADAKHGADHMVRCRPSDSLFPVDEVEFKWFIMDRLQLDRWMKRIPGDQLLTALAIPGTHDSGTEGMSDHTGRTQVLDMEQQFEMGTRVIDCRIQLELQIKNKFVEPLRLCFAHGIAQIDWIKFDDFIKNHVISWLTERPTECVILSIHDESNRRDDWEWQNFATLVSKTIYDTEPTQFWYLKNEIPTLEEVRGKIVLMRRYNTSSELNTGTAATAFGSIGLNAWDHWPYNKTRTFTNEGVTWNVQDLFSIEDSALITTDYSALILSKKWPVVLSQLQGARMAQINDPADPTLYLNYLNGVGTLGHGGDPSPLMVANEINPLTLDYLFRARRGRYGLVMFDHVSANLNAAVIASNNLIPPRSE